MMDDADMYETESSGSRQPDDEELLQLLDELDDDYYIPPPRPDLDLGQGAAHLNYCRAASPEMSYTSMSSEELLDSQSGELFTRIQLERTDSYSSCYSIDSEDCEKITPKVKMKENTSSSSSATPDLIAETNDLRSDCLTVEFSYKAICDTLKQLSEVDIKKFCVTLWKNYPKSFHISPEELDMLGAVDSLLNCYGLLNSLHVTRRVLEQIGRKRAAANLQNLCLRNEVRHDLCQSLRTTYAQGEDEMKPFSDVYTDLYITSTFDNGPNIEHEVLTIEKLDSNLEAGHVLSTRDILSEEEVEQSNTRLMFLTGVAGSGKSSVVRKLILDWVDKHSHKHVSFLFPLPFRDLKQFEGDKVSLLDILHKLYPETQRLKEADFRSEDCTMMFVCDGLEEYQDDLDFLDTELLSDHTERTSLNVLVVNLLRGRLLYRGLLLVTTRPQVRSFIPWDAHHHVIEVRGFCEAAKADYFRKMFEDQAQAASVLSYINSNPTLRIMCHLPLFCSLVVDECRRKFRDHGPAAGLPGSLCYMYTKLLTRLRRPLRAPDESRDSEAEFLMKLGKLAFHLLEQGKFKINKSDWSKFRVNDVEAVTYSGLCTEYLTKPFVLYEEKVISFIHPTVQEHLAARYTFLSFKNEGKNVFEAVQSDSLSRLLKSNKKSFYHSAVDRSLQCDDGRLDMFLRFLSGMHVKANTADAAAILRKRIDKNQHPERNHNLSCCLWELQLT